MLLEVHPTPEHIVRQDHISARWAPSAPTDFAEDYIQAASSTCHPARVETGSVMGGIANTDLLERAFGQGQSALPVEIQT